MTTDVLPDVVPAEGSEVDGPSAPNVVTLPNGHTVTLRPEISTPLGMAALRALTEAQGHGIEGAEYALTTLWLGCAPNGEPYTIESWDFPDEPITDESIARLLPFNEGGYEVAAAAGRLYGEHVIRPFLKLIGRPSNDGSTGNGTPRKSPNGRASRGPSKRSSRNGTAGTR